MYFLFVLAIETVDWSLLGFQERHWRYCTHSLSTPRVFQQFSVEHSDKLDSSRRVVNDLIDYVSPIKEYIRDSTRFKLHLNVPDQLVIDGFQDLRQATLEILSSQTIPASPVVSLNNKRRDYAHYVSHESGSYQTLRDDLDPQPLVLRLTDESASTEHEWAFCGSCVSSSLRPVVETMTPCLSSRSPEWHCTSEDTKEPSRSHTAGITTWQSFRTLGEISISTGTAIMCSSMKKW